MSYVGAAIWDPFLKNLINITLAELTCWLVAHSAQYVQHKCRKKTHTSLLLFSGRTVHTVPEPTVMM